MKLYLYIHVYVFHIYIQIICLSIELYFINENDVKRCLDNALVLLAYCMGMILYAVVKCYVHDDVSISELMTNICIFMIRKSHNLMIILTQIILAIGLLSFSFFFC